jgi:hypothetical protein
MKPTTYRGKTDFVIVIEDGSHWPGLLPFRGLRSRRGYPTWQEANDRLLRIATAYAARGGSNSFPRLGVHEREQQKGGQK